MGLLDTVATFFGDHGVAIVPVRIDERAPSAVVLALDATTLTGTFEVHSKRPVRIASHRVQLVARRRVGEHIRTVVLAEQRQDATTDEGLPLPYRLTPDQAVHDRFELEDLDLGEALATLGLPDATAGLADPTLRVSLELFADVQGSPIDTELSVPLPVAAAREPVAAPEPREAWIRTAEVLADPRPWLERFHERVAELRAHPDIRITELEVRPPATEAQLAAARAYHPIPDALEALYRQANGVTLRWELDGHEDVPVRGDIDLLPVEHTFRPWDLPRPPLHPVDHFVPEASVAIALHPDSTTGGMHDSEDGVALELTVDQWLEALLKTRGFWYWPRALVTDLTGEEWTTEPRQFRTWMPRLFPDVGPHTFLRRTYDDTDSQRTEDRADLRGSVRRALQQRQVAFQLVDRGAGYLTLRFADQPDNYERLVSAMGDLGVELGPRVGWDARSIGSLMFEPLGASDAVS